MRRTWDSSERNEEENQSQGYEHDWQVIDLWNWVSSQFMTTIFCCFSVEKKEADLKKNMTTVEKDKQKIEETIEELDRYKRDALQKTWEKVNA